MQRLVLNFIGFIIPLFAVVAPLSTPLLTFIYLLYVLLSYGSLVNAIKGVNLASWEIILRNKTIIGSIVLFICLCFFSATYSITPAATVLESIKLLCIAAVGIGLISQAFRPENAINAKWFIAGYCLALLVCIVEYKFSWPITTFLRNNVSHSLRGLDHVRLNRSMIFIVEAVWVLLIMLRGGLSLIPVLLSIVVVFESCSETAKLGGIIGAMVYVLGRLAPGFCYYVMQCAVTVLQVAVPLVFHQLIYNHSFGRLLELLPWSFEHRLYLWQNVIDLISMRPIIGYGFDASRAISKLHDASLQVNGVRADLLPVHPHNAILQVLLELGVIGLVAYIAFWVFAVKVVRSIKNVVDRAAVYAVLASYITMSQSSFDIWMSCWIFQILIVLLVMIGCMFANKRSADF